MAHLKDRDPQLGVVIDRIGRIEREMQLDVFTALVHSIVSQQISNAAAATVWGRLSALLGVWTPERLAEVAQVELRACGPPPRKAEWLQHLSHQVRQGDLDLSALPALSDAAVVQTLSALPGIGVWTAEMLLIFALGRPDVVSRGDQAIQRGMRRLYGLETLNQTQFTHYRERYRPYGTVASFYLWALASGPSFCGRNGEQVSQSDFHAMKTTD
ncbi:MAG: DNA-3-methyladenine glycosylase 2 family protein [Candidatus Competibacteraceae bacterium]|nr:DNA-3-methyladenine glycosylase 2 family protein [Candidatus Competibacteraceae bacterium]